jgi:hypothetical protein
MKTGTSEKAKNIKTIIGDSALKSKEAIKEVVSMNTKMLNQAVNANKAIVDEIKKQFQLKGNGQMLDEINRTFAKSFMLSEETIDSILDAYSKQIQLFVDYNTKLVDMVYDSTSLSMDGQGEKILNLVRENFDKSVHSMTESMKSVVDTYNKHTNLALNFNKKFSDTITSQFQAVKDFQNNTANYFNNWSADWWKQDSK